MKTLHIARLAAAMVLSVSLLPATAPGGGPRMEAARVPPDAHENDGAGRPIERWMRRLERRDPETHARLERLQREDPEAFRTALRERLAEMRRAHQARTGRTREPSRSKTEHPSAPRPARPHHEPLDEETGARLSALARRYHATQGGEREAFRAEMRQVLAEWAEGQFDQAEHHILRLEAHLNRLRHLLNERREKQDEMIQRRLDALIRRHQP